MPVFPFSLFFPSDLARPPALPQVAGVIEVPQSVQQPLGIVIPEDQERWVTTRQSPYMYSSTFYTAFSFSGDLGNRGNGLGNNGGFGGYLPYIPPTVQAASHDTPSYFEEGGMERKVLLE